MGDIGYLICPYCAEDFSSKDRFEDHKATDGHRIKYLNHSYHANRKSFVQDKNGLSIQLENQGLVEYKKNINTILIKTDEEVTFGISLSYTGSQNILFYGVDTLNKGLLLSSGTKVILDDDHQVFKNKKILKFKTKSKYKLDCTIQPGCLVKTLHIPIIFRFAFENEDDFIYYGKTFEICGSNFSLREFGDYIKGVQLPTSDGDDLERTLPLAPHFIQGEFTRLAYDNDAKSLKRLMGIDSTLNRHNYVNFFKTLLWLEELQLNLDIQYYSKKNTLLTPAPDGRYNRRSNVKCAELKVEGLGENRPSVLLGDKIMASPSSDRIMDSASKDGNSLDLDRTWYEGIVHNVTCDSAYLAFDQLKFMNYVGKDGFHCDIEFLISRHCLKVCHRALSLCKRHLSHLLFPTRSTSPVQLPEISPYNESISENPEQLQAVEHIVAGSSYPSPYLIFGPPGTGKTVTVVESIKQVLYHYETSHVLACAPSNSAADVITECLLDDLTNEHVYRLYAPYRLKYASKISARVRNVSNIKSETKVVFPCKSELMKMRVLVCTYLTAARLAAASFPPNFFTHVFLDEVGQAMEPEALVPIGGILSQQSRLILAGDHHQLGPVVRSMQAKGGEMNQIFPNTGLETSYLERLMDFPMYQEDRDGRFNPRYVTKLLNNYRSHKDILKVPNELFYKSQLRVNGDPTIIDSMVQWKELPKAGFPLIFHSIDGQDKMEARSPSYYNKKEVALILKYIKKLLESSELGIKHKEIGIITPYSLQVQKIKDALRNSYPSTCEEFKVGSVEDFQGDERKVILISTVRATKMHLHKDQIFALGFLRNPKRFNVAVTRAKSLLIICGCANLLNLDKNWKKLIEHIRDGGGFVGDLPPSRVSEDLDTIISEMSNVDTRPVVGKISVKQIIEAPPFGEQ